MQFNTTLPKTKQTKKKKEKEKEEKEKENEREKDKTGFEARCSPLFYLSVCDSKRGQFPAGFFTPTSHELVLFEQRPQEIWMHQNSFSNNVIY